MGTYSNTAEAEADRAQQLRMLEALGAWNRPLRKDECAAWCISGKHGRIYSWGDGKTWALWVHCRSPRHWTATKRRLAFCELTQDCDEEGCLRLRRLPTLAEATVIRDVLGIRKRAVLGPAERERRRAIGKRLARGAGRANAGGPLPSSHAAETAEIRPRVTCHSAGCSSRHSSYNLVALSALWPIPDVNRCDEMSTEGLS
jgi:hypothetical protein